ncbi:kinase domain-containing protein [Apiospora sp. TS-2023a]
MSSLIRSFPRDGFEVVPTDILIQEERLSTYDPKDFYPVTLGEILGGRYQVLAKLGFGAFSTTWLCRDLHNNIYRTVKVCVLGCEDNDEVAISDHITSIESDHIGKQRLRLILDRFQITGLHGSHQCLVFAPLGPTLDEIRKLFINKTLEKETVQFSMYYVLHGLDFLHQAGVVHTDLSLGNILCGLTDDAILSEIEEAELNNPCQRKILPDRTIYLPRRILKGSTWLVITDFGGAQLGEPGQKYRGDVMLGDYRPPEVILDMEWDSKMIWELLEGRCFFESETDGQLDDERHLAEMASVMGPPPKAFLERSKKCQKYWDSEGNWIAATPIPDQSLETLETKLEGEDKERLLALCRKILRWLPEKRPAAEGLYYDDFLLQWNREDGGGNTGEADNADDTSNAGNIAT